MLKKRILFLGLMLLPLSTLSVNLQAKNKQETCVDDEEKFKEKVKNYALWDFIKLTGRQNAEVAKISEIQGGWIKRGYIVWYKNSGYSILDKDYLNILEVNPFYDTRNETLNNYESNSYIYSEPGQIRENMFYDKTLPGDHKHEPHDPFKKFKYSDLEKVKNAKKEEFSKLGIREIKNGFAYADYEVDHSWWFKTVSEKTYGKNSNINSSYEYLNENTKYYEKYPSYYWKYYKKWTKKGICGYIGVISLLQYMELFKSSGYFSNWEINEFWETNNYTSNKFYDNFKLSDKYFINDFYEKNVLPKVTNDFVKYLYQKTWFYDGTNKWWHLKYISDSLIYSKWKASQINYSYWGDYTIFGKPYSTIKNYKTPTLLAGFYGHKNVENEDEKIGHVITAYGVYEDGRFLANYGWNDQFTQVITSSQLLNHGMNFSINNKSSNALKKMFNWNGQKIDGVEMTNKLKELGIIKNDK